MSSDEEIYSFQNKSVPMTKDDVHLNQLAYVGQISAGIAHEVRNPLTVVKGFLQLLQKEVENKYIDIAQSELENAITTLNNLLQLSKPDSENETEQTMHLSVELESILNLFQDQLYQIELNIDLQHTDTTFSGRKNQLKKAFFNLIKNAIESMEGNKGKLTIKHEVIDEEIVVTIEDTGSGIPENKLSLLGTPFFTTKVQGTGMGLAQVYAIVYQHGGKIEVSSQENAGTSFKIKLPLNQSNRNYEVTTLQLEFEKEMDIKQFLLRNREAFEELLLHEAINVREHIEEIHSIGNINLLENAHKLVLYIVDRQEHELISFAKHEGIVWAEHSLTLAFKLEWLKAIRRALWDFLYNFDRLKSEADEPTEHIQENFYELERKINTLVDQFMTYFFIHYSKYKDEQLDKQRTLLHHLSAPIIPIRQDICILPLVGIIDTTRLQSIKEKILLEIERKHMQVLIIDMSGVAKIEHDVIDPFLRTMDGIHMMGCRSIVTGLRAESVTALLSVNNLPHPNIEYKGTLQLALDAVLNIEQATN